MLDTSIEAWKSNALDKIPNAKSSMMFCFKYLVFSVSDQLRSDQMITVCLTSYIQITCNLEHSSMTFELPILSAMKR